MVDVPSACVLWLSWIPRFPDASIAGAAGDCRIKILLKFGNHEGEHEHVQEDAEEALGHRKSVARFRDGSYRPERHGQHVTSRKTERCGCGRVQWVVEAADCHTK